MTVAVIASSDWRSMDLSKTKLAAEHEWMKGCRLQGETYEKDMQEMKARVRERERSARRCNCSS
jgi:hypothetical protein